VLPRSRFLQSVMRGTAPSVRMSLPSGLRRLLHRLAHWRGVRLFLIYRDTKSGDYAAGLAFNALLTMFPIFLGLLTLLGLVSRNEDLDLRMQQAIVTTFPTGVQVEVRNSLLALRRDAGAYGLVAIVWLVWSGTGYFSHLEWAMNRIYISQDRSFWKQRLMGIGMICALSVSIAAGVIFNAALAAAPEFAGLGFVANWLVLALLLWSMYWIVPNRRVSARESLPGAILTALLIQVLNLAFPVYLHLTHNFNAFGRGLLLFLVFVTWLYLVSQLILLGAIVNRMQLGRLPTIGRSHESTSPWES
jgi:membrane protein